MSPIPSPMSRGELAYRFGISTSTLRRRLEKINLNLPNECISPKDVIRICVLLDWPLLPEYREIYKEMLKSGELKK